MDHTLSSKTLVKTVSPLQRRKPDNHALSLVLLPLDLAWDLVPKSGGEGAEGSVHTMNEQMEEEMNIRFIHILILTILIEK